MKIIWLIFICALVGCVSNTVQTDRLYSSESNLKSRVENAAPFIHQEVGHCGPATLAMAIGAIGKSVDLPTLTEQVYSPNAKGTLQETMIASARRQGFLAVPINGLVDLLKEIEAGHVVVIFENLGIQWIPQWHYALVTGYDLSTQTLVLHSGPNANEQIKMKEFELSWKLGNYWGLVVLPPGELSASADEFTHLRAAAALEKLEKYSEAEKAYQGILSRWPNSLIARIGLGNVYYNQQKYSLAVRYLKKATKLHPTSTEARNNLQIASQALRGR